MDIREELNRRTPPISITRVRFIEADATARARGIIGLVRCIVNDVLGLNGLTLRRTRDGRVVLVFPGCRRDRTGRGHRPVAVLDPETRFRFLVAAVTAARLRPAELEAST